MASFLQHVFTDARALALCFLLALAGAARAQESSDRVVDAVVHDACDKRVVILSEPPMHGFARTRELETEVTRRLMSTCGFNAFLIESGTYDFLEMRTKLGAHEPITRDMLAAAFGLWAAHEVEPLLPLLLDRAQRGALVLGGLDDQINRGTYAQLRMPADLSEYLAGDDKARCLAVFQKHMLWQYTNDAPYAPRDKASILECADKIGASLRARPSSLTRDDGAAMLDNLRRRFARDFRGAASDAESATQDFNDRDRSMYENFKWWLSRLPAGNKVIVWTATNHAAKDLAAVEGSETLAPLGRYVRREFNDHAFVLGFSALAGTYAMVRQSPRTLAAAPANSLEAREFESGNGDIRYVDAKALSKLGPIAARPLGRDFKTVRWSDVVDGLVIFRDEHPPSASAPSP